MLDTRLFLPEYRGKYPHMFPRDINVWERFLDHYGHLYKGFYYDITCGKGTELPEHVADPYKRDAYILSKLRIDAIGDQGNELHLIEVKPKLNAASVGQILTYKEHYMNEYKPTVPVRMVLVGGDIDENITPLTLKNGIATIVV